MTEFRRRLRAAGVSYVVVKNTLAQRALAANSVAGLDDHLAGPTGLVLAGKDPVARGQGADRLRQGVREAGDQGRPGGRQAGHAGQVKRLASLPSREVLLSQLAGAIQAPMAQLAGVLNGMLYQLVGALEALRAQRS